MSALTGPRQRIGTVGRPVLGNAGLPVKANVVIYDGAIVCVSGGYLTKGQTATGLIAAGVADLSPATASVTGGASDGAVTSSGAVNVRFAQGVFKFVNSTSADQILQANVGQLAYIVDDQTVALTSANGTRSVAGVIMGIDDDGSPYVSIGLQLLDPAAANVVDSTAADCVEVSTSVTLSAARRTTRLTVGGTLALPLPDGTYAGQRKTLFVASVSGTPAATVTPAHASGFTTILFGAASGKSSVDLEWDNSIGTPAWKLVNVTVFAGATVTIT